MTMLPLRSTRRSFLQRTILATGGATLVGSALADGAPDGRRSTLQKALIAKRPDEKTLTAWREAGFDGIEVNDWEVTEKEAEAGRRVAQSLGMKVHSVMRGWTNVNTDDPAKFDADIESVRHAIRVAAVYGADAVLWIPCRVGGMPMPRPWDFDIQFDETTLEVSSVARGEHPEYAEYIAAQNRANNVTRRAVERLAPVAESHGVTLALENVWNNLWVKPDFFAALVRQLDHPHVRAYFDIGNHVKYAPPQQWIRALGSLIVKLHVKDFKIDREADRGGQFVAIREGDVDWPQVRRAIDEVGYRGFLTIEGAQGLSLEQQSQRLDKIIDGV